MTHDKDLRFKILEYNERLNTLKRMERELIVEVIQSQIYIDKDTFFKVNDIFVLAMDKNYNNKSYNVMNALRALMYELQSPRYATEKINKIDELFGGWLKFYYNETNRLHGLLSDRVKGLGDDGYGDFIENILLKGESHYNKMLTLPEIDGHAYDTPEIYIKQCIEDHIKLNHLV